MKFKKENSLLLGTQITVLLLGIVLIVLSLCNFETHTKDVINMIGWLTAVFALLSFLLTLQLDHYNQNVNNQLFSEREKISKLYKRVENFLTEDELETREKKLGLSQKNFNNHVIIMSNDLSKECGEWIEAVIENIKNDVKYTYITTKAELKYIIGIKKALEKENIIDIDKKLVVYCNESFFDLMQNYSEIVIYDNIGSVNLTVANSNIQECYICFSNDPDNEMLLYEKVNKDYCKRILSKLGIYDENKKEVIQEKYCKTCKDNLGTKIELSNLIEENI